MKKILSRRKIMSACLGVGCIISAKTATAQALYTLTDLNVPETEGINSTGTVVGTSGGYAFRYQNGVTTNLGVLPAASSNPLASSTASGVNSSGQITGSSTNSSSGTTQDAFLYSSGTMSDIGTLNDGIPAHTYRASYGYAINASGAVTGTSYNGSVTHAFLYTAAGGMQDIGGSFNQSQGLGINSSGEVVGNYGLGSGNYTHALMYTASNGTVDINPTIPGSGVAAASSAVAITDAGTIVGNYSFGTSPISFQYPYLQSGATITTLPTLSSDSTIPAAINDYTFVVGNALPASSNPRAFIYSNGATVDLNSLVTNVGMWLLTGATGINDLGQITVNGVLTSNLNGPLEGFLLNQIPLTWNNSGGSGNGSTWDVATNQNWNNSASAVTYNNGLNVLFNDTNAGHYNVTLNATVSPASVSVNNSAGNYAITGAGGIGGYGSLAKTGSQTLTLGTVNTYTGGTTVSAGKLVVGVTGAMPNGAVNITGGALALATSTGLAQLTSLSITGNGVLDIANNHMIITYASGTQTTVDAAIRSYIIAGRNAGAWNGLGGINSSIAALPANNHYAIGYADGADHVVAGLSSGQIEIKYTLLGDADLDGAVTGSDFTALVGNLGKSGRTWDQGDFDYDGSVTGSDFTALVGNLGKSATGAAITLPAADYAAIDAFAAANGLMADVPEPASIGIGLAGGVFLLSRGRSSRHSIRKS